MDLATDGFKTPIISRFVGQDFILQADLQSAPLRVAKFLVKCPQGRCADPVL